MSQGVQLADETDFDVLWESCQEVLRRHHFRLDRVDRRGGTITTFPETSQNLFEFWRHDVDTAYDLWESTLRTVCRRAIVQVDRDEGSGQGLFTVTVYRQTFATPERQFNNSAATLRVFGETLPGVAGEPLLTRADDYWIDDGRDGAMENRLVERILRRAGMPPTPTATSE
ncbi:MAG TPA: hypothetical protein VM243_03805 [Phycisphaerae bacterium]|nr:hypothetical protein [Phycisphaerae bacterium]